MTESTPGLDWLEELQRKAYADTGLDPQARLMPEAEAGLAQRVVEALGLKTSAAELQSDTQAFVAQSSRGRPATRFDDLALLALIHNHADAIEQAAAELGWALPTRPVLGTLPLGQLNGLAIQVPNTEEYVIAFQRGVIGFINLLTKAVAAALPPSKGTESGRVFFEPDVRKVAEALRRDDEPLRRLAAFVGAYVLVGHPHAAPPYVLVQPAISCAAILNWSCLLFVAGHEYGHMHAGHLAVEGKGRRMVGGTEVDVAASDWNMEYEADFLGMVLATKALSRKVDLALAFAGLDLLFSVMTLVDRAISTLLYGAPGVSRRSDTHPPPQLRRQELRDGLNHLPVEPAAIRGAVELSSGLEAVLDLMWTLIEPKFVRLHSEGARPARCWTA